MALTIALFCAGLVVFAAVGPLQTLLIRKRAWRLNPPPFRGASERLIRNSAYVLSGRLIGVVLMAAGAYLLLTTPR